MLNTNPLNTYPLNATKAPVTASQWILTLNGLDISSGSIKATNIQDNAIANVNSYDIPQNHGKGFLSYFKRGRAITMTIYIKWSSVSDFISNLDAFRKACFTENAFLDWKRDWVVRRIKVNCTSNPQVFNHYNIDFLKVQVSFEALEPFWYEIGYQSTSITDQTASFVEEISTLGTAQSDVQAYVLFETSNSTEVKMKISENEITVNHNFSDGDVLHIDGENKRVYVWETSVDYSGIFPFMWTGSNFFDFTINGTFNCDVLILNKKSYV